MHTKSSRQLLFGLFLFIAFFADPFDPGAQAAVPVPAQLILNVRETAGVSRSNEVVRSGVPIPRSLNLRATSGLTVVNPSGQAVPADFEVTARWNAAKSDTSAPIQWLLVSFPATVGANASAGYRLVTNGSAGSNPAPARPLTLTRNGNAVTVDTGAAVFRFGANSGLLFDEVVLDNGRRLIGGGNLSLRTAGTDYGHATTRRVWVERQGALSAVVVVQGAYDTPAIGGGQLSTRRRYVFTAGSPTAVVRHVVNWEGRLACDGCMTTSSGAPNGVRVERVRDELAVELGGTPTVTAIGSFGAPATTSAVSTAQSAWVRQQLRASRTAPLRFDVSVANATAAGAKADGALLSASGPYGTVAIALDRMHRYEPQALRLLAGGKLAVDLVDDKAWLANHQGLYATLAVTATAGTAGRQDLERLLWAPLNRPLHAWAQPEWFAASEAVDDFPVGSLPVELAPYDLLIRSVLDRTVQQVDTLGLNGLMTFGLYPRYWGKTGEPGEVDCGGGDPTPNEAWDNTFWCGTWTDYHNTVSTAPVWAMRSGEVEWLDEIAFPGALRMLHTQIMQCSPTEGWFYCGQAPAGYGGYREDFNSSHAYFENLLLYYWLTGDATVIDIVQRGADSMRRWMCPQRGPQPVLLPNGPGGPACAADSPVRAEASMTGRVGQQWQSVFRFLGLASSDASFLEDFRLNFGRAVTQQYAQLTRNGKQYGLWGGIPTTAGTYTTDAWWTIPLYDMNNLHRLQRDTGDAPIGIPGLKPSQVLANVARTFPDIEATVMGDGTLAGLWARKLQYTFTGSRIGGTLAAVSAANLAADEPFLYYPEKASAAVLLARAGQQSGEARLVDYGRLLTVYVIGRALGEGSPLGKLHGQNLSRLHGAVALFAQGGSTPPPPPPPPPPAPVAPSELAAQVASNTEITLTWRDNSDNEEQFRIERLTNGSFQQVLVVAANVTTVRLSNLTPGTTYSFRVRASNAAGTSGYTNTASVTLPAAAPPPPPPPPPPAIKAPTHLIAYVLSASDVHLDWRDNAYNETAYRVERQINGGAFQEIRVTASDVTSLRITGLPANTLITFRVRASNSSGYSDYSNSLQVRTKP